MERFLEITPEEARILGEFEYAPQQSFSPFVGKQENGNFIVSEEMYDLLKDYDQFKKVDWSLKKFVSSEELNFKQRKI